jgi:hypothetical protein
MKSSLTARLVRTLFFLIAATTATSMLIVEVFVNDVEDTILRLELKAEAEYFAEQLQQGRFQTIKTAQLEAFFSQKARQTPCYRNISGAFPCHFPGKLK